MTTLFAVPVSRLTSAREPDASAGTGSGTSTTTGYAGLVEVDGLCAFPVPGVVALPAPVEAEDELVEGSRLMEVTAPGTGLVAPCGVTEAVCPTRTEAIEASGTLTVTSTAPAPTITTFSPELEVPFTKVTEPTVPAIGDFSVAETRSA